MNRKTKKRIPIIVVSVLVAIILCVLLVMVLKGKVIDYNSSGAKDNTVMINGERYEERPNLEKYLFYGIDEYSKDKSSVSKSSADESSSGESSASESSSGESSASESSSGESSASESSSGESSASESSSGESSADNSSDDENSFPGQCDVIMLMIIDKTQDTVSVIQIDRNTEATVYTYDKDGKKTSETKCQVALANPQGYDEESSARSVMDSVSDLFYGVTLSRYMALKMDSIKKLNHLAGGVTVTIKDDFGKADPTLKKGATVRLTDDQAETYVRGRMTVGSGTNEERMDRQRQFLEGVKKAFIEKYNSDSGFIDEVKEELEDCMSTNMTNQDYSKIAKAEKENEDLGTFKIKGKNTKDNYGSTLLIPEQESIDEIATTLIFRKAE